MKSRSNHKDINAGIVEFTEVMNEGKTLKKCKIQMFFFFSVFPSSVYESGTGEMNSTASEKSLEELEGK